MIDSLSPEQMLQGVNTTPLDEDPFGHSKVGNRKSRRKKAAEKRKSKRDCRLKRRTPNKNIPIR